MLGNSLLVSTEAEEDLGVVIDAKMNMGQQCGDAVRKANCTLSCIHRCISSKSKEVILPLYAALVRPQLEYCVQFWAPHFQEGCRQHGEDPEEATCMIRGQQGRPYERLRDLNLFSLQKRRLRGDLVACYKLVGGGSAGIAGVPVPPSTTRSDQE